MGIWIFILVSVIAATGLGAVYMTTAVGRFSLIKKAAGERSWLRRLISFGVIAAVFALFCITMSLVNAIMIFLHVLIFWLIFDLLGLIVKKCAKKSFKVYWQGWCAMLASVVYLSVGYYLCNNVWVTTYKLTTDKDIDHLHVVMFADSHICATFDGEGFAGHVKDINEEHPDIVLIPGDFVDDGTDRDSMVRACEALGTIDAKYGVWFAYGNHDKGYYGSSRGFSSEDLEAELKKNGIHILEDEYELIDDKFYIVGRADKSFEDRKPMADLIKDLDSEEYILVMDHQPADYDAEAATEADLVVSGHTHGGQFFPVTHLGVLMRVNDRTYGYENRNGTDFIVTSGIADWEIKFKTGTKSEYVVIDIN